MIKTYYKVGEFFNDFKYCLVCGIECNHKISSFSGDLDIKTLPNISIESDLTESGHLNLNINDDTVYNLTEKDLDINIKFDFNRSFLTLESYCDHGSDHGYWAFTTYLTIEFVEFNKYKLQPYTISYESICNSKYNVCNFYNTKDTLFYTNDGDYIGKMQIKNLNVIKNQIDKIIILL